MDEFTCGGALWLASETTGPVAWVRGREWGGGAWRRAAHKTASPRTSRRSATKPNHEVLLRQLWYNKLCRWRLAGQQSSLAMIAHTYNDVTINYLITKLKNPTKTSQWLGDPFNILYICLRRHVVRLPKPNYDVNRIDIRQWCQNNQAIDVLQVERQTRPHVTQTMTS
jgi:hypothetical protein